MTNSPGLALPMSVATVLSSSAMLPWRRSNSQGCRAVAQLVGGLSAKLLLDLVEAGFRFGRRDGRLYDDAAQVSYVHDSDTAGPAL